MPWERYVDGEWIAQPSSGQPDAPPRHEAVSAGSPHPRTYVVSAGPPHLVSAASAGAPRPRACTPLGEPQGPPRPQAVCAGPSQPRAVTPLGDKVPPRREAVRAGPPSGFAQLRELHERHKREDAVIRKVLRRARAARRAAWRPRVVHGRPASTRPREGGARVVMASGRDGTGQRDDGSGDSDGDGGGGGEPPPQHRSHAPFSGSVR